MKCSTFDFMSILYEKYIIIITAHQFYTIQHLLWICSVDLYWYSAFKQETKCTSFECTVRDRSLSTCYAFLSFFLSLSLLILCMHHNSMHIHIHSSAHYSCTNSMYAARREHTKQHTILRPTKITFCSSNKNPTMNTPKKCVSTSTVHTTVKTELIQTIFITFQYVELQRNGAYVIHIHCVFCIVTYVSV